MTPIDNSYLARGKRIHSDEWIVGLLGQGFNPLKNKFYLSISEVMIDIPDRESGWFVSGRHITIDPAMLGRCTGLSAAKSYRGDKPEDLLIFEGDIIRVDCKGTVDTCGVRNEHGSWRIFGDYFDDDPLYDLMRNEIEIIGNIHDNPELLGHIS